MDAGQAIKERQQHFAKAASLERQLSVDEVGWGGWCVSA